jgi:DNA-binding LacI/PurR family transcriptional regulator
MLMAGRPPLQRRALGLQLRQRLARGEWSRGTWLPTERALADRFQVSRSALREALSTVDEVELVAGKGWRVRRPERPLVGRILQVRVIEEESDRAIGEGMRDVLADHDAEVVVWHRRRPAKDAKVPAELLTHIEGCSWLVLFSESGIPPAWVACCEGLGVRVLAVGCHLQLGYDAVCADFSDMSQTLVRAIHARGHRSIAFCGIDTLHHSNASFRARVTGYEIAMRELGLTPEVAYLTGNFDQRRSADREFATWLDQLGTRGHAPTCLYVSGPRFVSRVAAMLARIGRRVPDDLSMAGFGASPDVLHGERRLFAGFSHADEPWYDLGRAAGAAILARTTANIPPMVRLVTAPVVMGDSVRLLSNPLSKTP